MALFVSLFAFIVAIGVIVSFHEFGHFWTARRLGVTVLRYSIGFGRPLWSRRSDDGVEYVIAAIPLGGYVKMLDEREGPVTPEKRHSAFNRQSLGVRTAIVAAGPAFNFVLAFILYYCMFMVGVQAARPVVGEVVPDGVAERAGFETGDRFSAVEGRPVESWQQTLFALLGANFDRPAFDVEVVGVDGAQRTLSLDTAGVNLLEGEDPLEVLGIRPLRPASPEERHRYVTVVRHGAWESLGLAAAKTWEVTALTLQIMKRLFLGEASLANVNGPVGIAEYAGLSLMLGVGAFLGLLALLSVSIGILNLLPVPILDGGHLLYYLVEFVKGSPVSARTQLVGQWVGVILLGGLMTLALYNDLSRLLD